MIQEHCLIHWAFIYLPPVTAPPNKKRAWSWPAYLEEERATAAPVKLFKEVFCPYKNRTVLSVFAFEYNQMFSASSVLRWTTSCLNTVIYICVTAPVVSSKQEQF